jgi:hypothetical protein
MKESLQAHLQDPWRGYLQKTFKIFAQVTEITKADALSVSIPYQQNVNNDYPGTGYELPNSDWSSNEHN